LNPEILVLDEEISMWVPPERLSISGWAEKYRVLTKPPAEEPGPLRLERTPYLRPIMDMVQDPEVEQIVLCKSAQIAGTEAMLSILGYYVHQEPCSAMLVMADQDTAVYMSRERIQKMFTASRELSRVFVPEMATKTEITLANGSYIALGWASSVAKLASRLMRIVILDEVDKPGYYVTTKEADPISLAIQRTETYYNRKILILSTPTDEHGNIWRHLTACDVIYDWHVPCPYCGAFQPLRWSREFCSGLDDGRYRGDDGAMHEIGQVVWEGGREATPEQIQAAGYQCGSCGKVWDTVQKNNAVERGKAVPRTEIHHKPKRVGFHLNRLYSLLGKSGDIPGLVEEWLRSFKDTKKRQSFVNNVLAEPYRVIVAATSESQILKARCDLAPQVAPAAALALTCGVDVQKYGFWFAVRAWARDMSSWLIHYGQLVTWEEVEHLLFETVYPVEGMKKGMPIWRAAIDTGGGASDAGDISMTEETYNWLKANMRGRRCQVWGSKGVNFTTAARMAGRIALQKPRERMRSGKPMPGGLRLVNIDVGAFKDLVHTRIQAATMDEGLQPAYLHSETDDLYARHITAEEKRRNKRGLEEWVQVSRENHLLDCEVLAHACADREWPGGGVQRIRQPMWLDLEDGSRNKVTGQLARPEQRVVRSKWMSRTASYY
jgi:phage terminase large subunit GpA-like protein